MSDLFQRVVSVEFGREGEKGVRHSDLRVFADIKSSKASSPNTAEIKIWNLAQSSIDRLNDDKAVIRVFAGFRDSGEKLVFEGTPKKNGVSIERQGPEKVTKVVARDGGGAWDRGRLSISFSREVSFREVFQECVKSFGIPEGNIRLPNELKFPQGIHLDGSTSAIMTRLADSADSNFWIQNGFLNFWPKDTPTNPLPNAQLFSYISGNLIGAPTPTNYGVEIKTLLCTDIRPGMPFKLQSIYRNGNYIARDVAHKIDSGYDNEYYSYITGRPV
jgi:hypothetical protein